MTDNSQPVPDCHHAIGAENAIYTLLDGAGHGGAQLETESNLQPVSGFLDKHLK
jgi:hypothetical protein